MNFRTLYQELTTENEKPNRTRKVKVPDQLHPAKTDLQLPT